MQDSVEAVVARETLNEKGLPVICMEFDERESVIRKDVVVTEGAVTKKLKVFPLLEVVKVAAPLPLGP